MKKTGAALLCLLVTGCIDFRKDLEDFCARTGRCVPDGGSAGGSTAGGTGGSTAGGTGGSTAGGSGGGGGAGGATSGGSGGGSFTCTKEACQVFATDRNKKIWSIGGSSPNDVWFGAGQALFRFDGTTFANRQDNPSPMGQHYGVASTAPDDVWLSGTDYTSVWRYNGLDWRSRKVDAGDYSYSIYARTRDDAYMVASSDLFHWDGDAGTWEHIYTNPTDDYFYDLQSAPGQPVWGVADVQVYRIENDLSVAVELPPIDPSNSLVAVSVSPSGHVWAVGSRLGVFHRDLDGGWDKLEVDVGATSFATLVGVWARSDDDVWMAGEYGTFLHWRRDAGFTSRSVDLFDAGIDLNTVHFQDIWGMGNDMWLGGTTGETGNFGEYDGGVAVHFLLP